jgi:hypothetical protein
MATHIVVDPGETVQDCTSRLFDGSVGPRLAPVAVQRIWLHPSALFAVDGPQSPLRRNRVARGSAHP